MQIEYWAILAFALWMIVAITFVVACIRSDNKSKKLAFDDALKNKTVFFVEREPLRWEDLDFQGVQQPTVVLPDYGA